MAFIGAGSAAHTAVHEDFQRAEFLEPFTEPVDNDLLPVFRELPVVIFGRPFPRIGEIQPFLTVEVLHLVLFGRIGVIPRFEDHRDVHPVLGWYGTSSQGRILHDALG